MVILMSFCFGCLRCFTFSDLFRLSELEYHNVIYILNHHGIFIYVLYTLYTFMYTDRRICQYVCLF